MRLINTQTLQLEEFFEIESTRIRYAILSHTWGSEEVTLQEMQGDRKLIKHKAGLSKIRDSCKQAQRDEYRYIWVDTCCIDKTSSTELTEAINSMYKWYKESAVCYAYLPDVRDGPDFSSQFKRSRWFTRGWMLQELLAPYRLEFFDCNWSYLGTKGNHMKEISEITDIDLYALTDGDLRNFSVARHMSWAASRQTTRLEDLAYCLLGIFQINMPLLYGEGARAFQRLQEEIMKATADQSLFVWMDPSFRSYNGKYDDIDTSERLGLLASSPKAFKHSKNVAQFYAQTPGRGIAVSTNSGIRMDLLMAEDKFYRSGRVHVAVLDCPIGNAPGRLAGIRLLRLSPTGDHYARIDMPQLFHFALPSQASFDFPRTFTEQKVDFRGFDPTEAQTCLVDAKSTIQFRDWTVKSVFIRQETQVPLLPAFWFYPSPELSDNIRHGSMEAYPPNLWDSRTLTMQPRHYQGTHKEGALYVDCFKVEFILIFGVTWGQVPWCEVMPPTSDFRTGVADKQNGSRLKHIFEQFSETEVVRRPKDIWHCKETGLSIMAETVTVSGRETHVLRVGETAARYLQPVWTGEVLRDPVVNPGVKSTFP